MSMIRMILKEIGGRGMDAAGAIKSKSNMFEGSKNNAPSDKLMGSSGTDNPLVTNNEGEGAGDAEKPANDVAVEGAGDTDKPANDVAVEGTSDTSADVDSSELNSGDDITSDANAKTEVKSVSFKYQPTEGGRIRGVLKNLDFSPSKPKMQGAGGGMPGGAGAAAGTGGEGGAEGADTGADMGDSAGDMADSAGDMGDMADAADMAG